MNNLREALEKARELGRIVIMGHDAPDVDSAVSCALFRALCEFWGIEAVIVIADAPDAQSRRVLPHFGIHPDEWIGQIEQGDQLVLLDHHQTKHPGRMAVCIDHHLTACPPEADFVWIGESGACGKMVLMLMQQAGMVLTQQHRALAVCALYLDTIALRSAKILTEEADWARREAEELNLDTAWLEREGANLCDMTRPVEELAMFGKKTYDFNGHRVISTYVQTNAMTEERLEAVLAVLRRTVREEAAFLWVFLVHDPIAGHSFQYDIFPDGNVEKTAYDHLISRGKTVMPQIEKRFL